MIVEAIKTDVFTGPHELSYREHSRFACSTCGKTYEFIIHAAEGEFDAMADPLPTHFDLLCDQIDAGHRNNHEVVVMQTDGVRAWNPTARSS